jgi:prepilin-type N-terminal cleavage/methylation domain-containing protein
MNEVKSNQSGFTLIEIVTVILISSIMMIGLATSAQSIRQINARSRDVAVINSIAEDKIEQIRAQTFVALEDGVYDFTDELPKTINNSRSAQYVISSPNASNPAIKQVSVTISHNDFGDTVSYDYTTLIGELGVGQY